MSKELPDWVTRSQFELLLAQEYPTYQSIKKFKAFPALSHGENYLTTVLRVEIQLQLQDDGSKCVKYILKIPLSKGKGEDHEFHELFVAEADMYERLIPELEKLYAEVGDCVRFKPQHFKFPTPTSVGDYILLEDLQCSGFSCGNRLQGLDEFHTRCVLEKLAQWHAASAKRVEASGSYDENYIQGYFVEEHRQMITEMNEVFTTPFLDCLEHFRLSDEHKMFIRNYLPQLTELYLKFGEVHDEGFNVLNHGDFWLNNFMYQYHPPASTTTTKTPIIRNVVFLDFQMPKYGTPAQDLFCLLMTSPHKTLKLRKFDEFIAYYHEKLLENLRRLHYQRSLPTLSEIMAYMQRDGVWGFVCAQRMLAIALFAPSETSNIDAFMNNHEEGVAFKKRIFQNPAYVEQMSVILPWMIERDYLQSIHH